MKFQKIIRAQMMLVSLKVRLTLLNSIRLR